MGRYVIGRLLSALAVLIVSSVLVFFVVRLIPGDPISVQFGLQASPELKEAFRKLYGLDRPIYEQYFVWAGSLLSGNFGLSLITHSPVIEQLVARIPRTFYLMGGGLFISLLVAIPAAIVAARGNKRWPDKLVLSTSTAVMSVPEFWLGILLTLIFAVTLHWLPAAGFVDPGIDVVGSLRSMILPWATLGLYLAPFTVRVLRASLLDILQQDYIRTARARGVTENGVFYRHALKNAAIPVVTLIGLEVGYLMGGTIVLEKVFAYPGMGQLIINSVAARDYPVVQISVLFFSAGFVIVTLCTDLLYGLIDPRVRQS